MSEDTLSNLQRLSMEIDNLKNDLNSQKKTSMPGLPNPYSAQYQNSVVEWQLDLSKELELIHHQIRGHVIKRDMDGNEFWDKPEDEEQILLNEKGAQEIEKIIRNYLNKNTLLSNFDEILIKNRVSQFAHRLRRFIYLNYEEFGLTTYYKQKHFEMIVMNIVDMVESAYYRALNGGERESLTTIRQIIQSESFDNTPRVPQIMPQKRAGFFGRLFGR